MCVCVCVCVLVCVGVYVCETLSPRVMIDAVEMSTNFQSRGLDITWEDAPMLMLIPGRITLAYLQMPHPPLIHVEAVSPIFSCHAVVLYSPTKLKCSALSPDSGPPSPGRWIQQALRLLTMIVSWLRMDAHV